MVSPTEENPLLYLNKTVTICLLNEQVFCAVPVGTGDHPLFRFVALLDAGNREICTSLCPIGKLRTFFLNVASPCGRCSTHASSLCALCCVTRERPVAPLVCWSNQVPAQRHSVLQSTEADDSRRRRAVEALSFRLCYTQSQQ